MHVRRACAPLPTVARSFARGAVQRGLSGRATHAACFALPARRVLTARAARALRRAADIGDDGLTDIPRYLTILLYLSWDPPRGGELALHGLPLSASTPHQDERSSDVSVSGRAMYGNGSAGGSATRDGSGASGAPGVHACDGKMLIAPRPGRLVVFFAQEVNHEVLVSDGERFALTLWGRRRSSVQPLAPVRRRDTPFCVGRVSLHIEQSGRRGRTVTAGSRSPRRRSHTHGQMQISRLKTWTANTFPFWTTALCIGELQLGDTRTARSSTSSGAPRHLV
jgi:hypothetical protein